jgi:hypothetical protein
VHRPVDVIFAIVLLLRTIRYGKEPLFDSIGQITILVFLPLTPYTHTIYLRPAAEPKGLLTLSDTTLLMLHRGLTSPCAFFDSLLHAACCPRQSPCVISTSLVLYLSSLIRRLWVSIVGGRLAQSRLLQEIPQVFSVLSAAAEALSALLHKAVDEFVLVGEIHPVPGC